jgi:hypothetical protein
MKFARWVFLVAGIYGLMVNTALYFMEGVIGRGDASAAQSPGVLLRVRRHGACLAGSISGRRERANPLSSDDAPVSPKKSRTA